MRPKTYLYRHPFSGTDFCPIEFWPKLYSYINISEDYQSMKQKVLGMEWLKICGPSQIYWQELYSVGFTPQS